MIRIGPAGWSYRDWAGRVYPAKTSRTFDPLAYLAQFFDTIEINSTFYRIPQPSMASSWASRVAENPRFKFTLKLPQLFTHTHEASAADEASLKEGIAPLQAAGRLGAVLMQFPYAFHHTAANRDYVQQLVHRFGGFPLVLEVRHGSWDRPETYTFLEELGVGFCNIDQPRVSYSLKATQRVTSPVGYLRLHGRNAATWFREDAGRDARYDYLYADDELNEISSLLQAIAARAPEMYLITNNHFRGQAVVNALQLLHKLGDRGIKVPPELVTAYPQLAPLTHP
jgi:uncharacterized protein YecE (DUF72 family)